MKDGEMFNAKITASSDAEALVYLRYLAAERLYEEVHRGSYRIDYNSEAALRKNWVELRSQALKEIIK